MSPLTWLVVVAVVTWRHRSTACNVRELAQIIKNRFREEVGDHCGVLGDKCKFDQDCCLGLECMISASEEDLDNYCQRGLHSDPDRPELQDAVLSPPPANEQSSEEDISWMMPRSDEDEEGGEKDSDTLGEIERLQEKKRLRILKENQELEKLFTEKDERELEELRALKEDAELDELRRLKELRLKRKLKLIKELRELRGLNADSDLNKIQELRNNTKHTNKELSTIDMPEEPLQSNSSKSKQNELEQSSTDDHTSVGAENDEEYEKATNYKQDKEPEPKQVGDHEDLQGIEPSQELEPTTVKHKQGVHHRRKHHQQKHKKRASHSATGNLTAEFDAANIDNADEEAEEVKFSEGNKTESVLT